MYKLRLILVDDNAAFLQSAVAFLTSHGGFNVVGAFDSGTIALAHIAELQPDLVLVDLSMPGISGLDVTRQIKSRVSPPKVIVVTLHTQPSYRTAALAAGADGFVTKEAFTSDVVPLVKKLASPEEWRALNAFSCRSSRGRDDETTRQ